MTAGTTRLIRMARRPVGLPVATDFAVDTVALAVPVPGEIAVRLTDISLDPYIRLRMAARHLTGNLAPGDAIVSEAVGVVEHSADPGFAAGDVVAGFAPWAERAVVSAADWRSVDFGDLPASLALGVLGMPGLTAYAGITRLMRPGPGDVLIVSAAAGPVGSTVGQLARARGARTIAIAGGPDKCRWAQEAARFDAAIDYRAGPVAEQLAAKCPEGATAYFDNVGGALLREVLGTLRFGGRIVLCGIIDDYNNDERSPGPLPLEIISRRATLMGLVVYDHEDLRAAMIDEISGLIRTGRFAWREDVVDGLENAPAGFIRLMRGGNQGKMVVRL